jgi:hypothetical protein
MGNRSPQSDEFAGFRRMAFDMRVQKRFYNGEESQIVLIYERCKISNKKPAPSSTFITTKVNPLVAH